MLVIAVSAKVLLKGLIDPLSLSLSLRMISQGEVKFHAEGSTKTVEEVGDELQAVV